jgi:hypothetical protein
MLNQVEIFENEELKSVANNPEVGEAWREKIRELGLHGQESLIGGVNRQPIVFPVMTVEEIKVYKTVCSERCLIAEFKREAIPLRVLEVVGLAQKEGHFEKIEVWATPGKDDPVVVGYRKNPSNSFGHLLYLIARWGAELAPFKEIRKKAIELLTVKSVTQARTELATWHARLENMGNELEQCLQTDWHWALNA